MLPNEKQRRAVYELWDGLADIPASRADQALLLLMERVGCWLRADDVVWVGAAKVGWGAAARRDAQLGWRGLKVAHWRVSPELLARSQRATQTQEAAPGLTSIALAREAGLWRVHRLRDGWVDFPAFSATPHYHQFYREAGIKDRLFAGAPVNEGSESFLLVDRYRVTRPFSLADEAFLMFIQRGLKWFYRELLLFHGILMAEQPLSPVERRIVQLLLTEASEREIAERLGQAPATTHKYITAILRRYNVRGRTGLMARWLNRAG